MWLLRLPATRGSLSRLPLLPSPYKFQITNTDLCIGYLCWLLRTRTVPSGHCIWNTPMGCQTQRSGALSTCTYLSALLLKRLNNNCLASIYRFDPVLYQSVLCQNRHFASIPADFRTKTREKCNVLELPYPLMGNHSLLYRLHTPFAVCLQTYRKSLESSDHRRPLCRLTHLSSHH